MSEKELKAKAVADIEGVVADVPREPRVVHCEARAGWNEQLLYNVSEHKLHILARGGDIVVFYNDEGQEIGWRDDGRRGTEQPKWLDRESFRTYVVRELDLPKQTRLGRLAPRQLPPLGWTHEGVFFLSATPSPKEVLRVWVSPENNRVIQCLFGPVNKAAEGDDK